MTPKAKIPRSLFNIPFTHKTTFNASYLVPVYWEEVLPGDTFRIHGKFYCRQVTPITPVMDDAVIEFHSFFVPNRLSWEHWQELMGENKEGAWYDSAGAVPCPVCTISPSLRFSADSIGAYTGLPQGQDCSGRPVNKLLYNAIGLIWNEWYRDQNWQAPDQVFVDNSDLPTSNRWHPSQQVPKVNRYHDLFSSALPAPQKGPTVVIPLGEDAPVVTREDKIPGLPLGQPLSFYVNGTTDYPPNGNPAGWGGLGQLGSLTAVPSAAANVVYPNNLWADLSEATAANVNTIRFLFQLQKAFERDARGGTRYIEHIYAHFGVTSPDSRLQRPEYLGGHRQHINMTQVAQTSSTDATSPQGNVAAYSVTVDNFMIPSHSFTEHGIVVTFVSVRNKKSYPQGIDRRHNRVDRFDWYLPVFCHIGEVAVYRNEIFADGNGGNIVWGYQEAWYEYRNRQNYVSGQFAPQVTPNLAQWHYADVYAPSSPPVLSAEWMQDNSDVNIGRTVAVIDTELSHQYYLDLLINNRAVRPMSTYSVPGYVDHF